jgi:hypothetical protein
MKNNLPKSFFTIIAASLFTLSNLQAQNVSLNVLVLNSGVVPQNGTGTVEATINTLIGSGGQTTPVAIGKINLQISVPSSLRFATSQTNLPSGWTVRTNIGSVINICNSSTTLAFNSATILPITLEGVTVTSGSPILSGQLSFRTNCSAPGSLTGDNPSDNGSTAGFSVADVLPIKLSNFKASINNCQPVLSWTTESEIISDRFEVERSFASTSNNWRTIGLVNANGYTYAKTNYSFVDNTLSSNGERVLYRLKMIDQDSRFKYSSILPVAINCSVKQLFAYPNPVQNGTLQVSITGTTSNSQALLSAINGAVILKTTITAGTNSIDVSNVANGVYVLSVNYADGESKKIKVIIQQ